MIRERAKEEMKNGLPKHMDCKGNALSKNAETDDYFINICKIMVVPDRIVLGVQDGDEQSTSKNNTDQAQYKENYMNLMQSLPEHMDAFGNSLPSPSNFTNMDLSTKVHKR